MAQVRQFGDKARLMAGAGKASLVLALAWAASQASAQQTVPGISPNCQIIAEEAICQGDLEGGITADPADPPFSILTVRNVNGPIAPPGYFAIGVVKNDRDITINLDDDVVINVFDDPNIAGLAQGLIAIVDQGFDLTIDSGAAITANGNGSFALGIEALVTNGDGNLSITNRGAIAAFTDFESAIAISARAQNSTGDITITNSGNLSTASGGSGERDLVTAGILAVHETGGGDISITNSGAITVSAAGFDTDFIGIAGGIVANSFVGSNTTDIINSGTITASGDGAYGIVGFTSNDSTNESAALNIENRAGGTISIDGIANAGILAQSAGTDVDVTVQNNAAITMANGSGSSGIRVLIQSRTSGLSISNEGAISGSGGFLRGIAVSTLGAPVGGNYDGLIFNSANITLDTPVALGIGFAATRDGTVIAQIVNQGDLDLSDTTEPGSIGISINLGLEDTNAGGADGVTEATLFNSGAILMGAGTGIELNADTITATNTGDITIATGTGIRAEGFTDLDLTHNSSITTTGANSDGIVVDASIAEDWEVLVTDTGSIATSGAGSVGIRVSGVTQDYVETAILEATAATTVQKARLADQAMNAITQYITSGAPGDGGIAGTRSSQSVGNTMASAGNAAGGAGAVIVNGTVRADGGAGAILGESALGVAVRDADAVIATTGDDAPAISAQTSISLIGLDGLELTTTGANSALVKLTGGGMGTPGNSAAFVALNNLKASTQGDGSTAFVLDSGGGSSVANFEINNFADPGASATISTMGDNAHGVQFVTPDGGSTFAGEVEFTQLSTAGDGSLGFNLALGNTSSASLGILDSAVSTGGANSDAVLIGIGANSDALLLIRRSTVATTGNGSAAIDVPQLANGSIGNAVIIDTDISTEGDDARAFVFGELGGDTSSRTAFIAESTFTTQGDGSTALLFGALGNSSTSIFDTMITTAGSNARGIDHGLDGDGSATVITIANVSVTTTGAANAGAMIFEGTVDDDSAFWISLEDIDLSTIGTDSDALFIGGGGFASSVFSFDAANVDIATQGNNSRGFVIGQFIAGDGSTTVGDMLNINVATQGANAHGIWLGTSADGAMVNSSSAFSAANLDITTQGDGARGFFLEGLTGDMIDSDFTLLLRDSTISTAGADAIGLELGGIEGSVANSGRTIVLANLDITTGGDGAHGLVIGPNLDDFAISNDLAYDDIVVSTTGAGAHALYLRTGARFSMTEANGLTLDATGMDAFEVFVGMDAQFALLSGALRRSDGSFADALVEGGTLSGGGSLGSVTLIGGTLAPGNSIGTLTVNGALTFDSDSTFAVEVNSNNTSDLVTVNGNVTLGGSTLDIIELAGSMFTDTNSYEYTIIANDGADAVNGTFGTIRNPFAFLDAEVLYGAGDGNDVVLQLLQQLSFPEVAQSFNQTQAAQTLAQFDRTPGSDSNEVYNALLQSTTQSALAAFDSASGEIYASLLAARADAGLVRSQRLLARTHERAGEGWGLWGGISGSSGDTDFDGNAADASQSQIVFDLGMDYRGSDSAWAIGAAVSYINGDLDVDDRASEADYDGWGLGVYARYGTGNSGFSLSAALDFSDVSANVTRDIAVNTISRRAIGSADVQTISLSGEARYGFGEGDWAFGPVVSIHYADGQLDGASETGAASLNLSVSESSFDQTRLGGGLFANFQGENGGFDLSAQYVGGEARFAQARLTLDGAPGTPFAVRSPRVDGDGGLFAASGHHALGGGWTLGGEARVFAGSQRTEVAASATLGWRF
ncbi:MAG: hypothetical protein CVT75_07375 [Alphaproteobacteria bacterium HGW-Alphaproteobacteria-14]|nr:MAG: hypothetical protein CVT75_07375 [Alphaproteobacteria bacterium HGW-Alphaproteobacteria-14]